MANNFAIAVQKIGSQVIIKPEGDFDGTSACEIIALLDDVSREASWIVVDTNHIKKIYSFGLNVFLKHIKSIKYRDIQLDFNGKNTMHFSALPPADL
jgi:anti-anti-sigma factor